MINNITKFLAIVLLLSGHACAASSSNLASEIAAFEADFSGAWNPIQGSSWPDFDEEDGGVVVGEGEDVVHVPQEGFHSTKLPGVSFDNHNVDCRRALVPVPPVTAEPTKPVSFFPSVVVGMSHSCQENQKFCSLPVLHHRGLSKLKTGKYDADVIIIPSLSECILPTGQDPESSKPNPEPIGKITKDGSDKVVKSVLSACVKGLLKE